MKICDNCGRPLAEGETECSICNPKKTEENQVEIREFNAEEYSKILKASLEAEAKKKQTEKIAEEKADQEDTDTNKIVDRPIVSILKKTFQAGKSWLILVGVLVLVLVLSGLGKLISEKISNTTNNNIEVNKITPELRRELDIKLASILEDKLKWGREVMRKRLPSRFPEELILDKDLTKAEVKFENNSLKNVYYYLLVAYHFKHDHEATYRWKPVTIYFEQREQEWVYIGEKWLNEWDLEFE